MAVKDKPGKSKEQVQKSLELSDVVEALRRYRKSKDVSVLPPIQQLYDALCRHKGQCGAKTTDTINWLGSAARDGTGYYPALLNELSSDEVLGDIETEFQQPTSGGKADLVKTKSKVTANLGALLKRIIGWIFKKASHFIFAVFVTVVSTVIAAIVVVIFSDFGWIERIKTFVHNILTHR